MSLHEIKVRELPWMPEGWFGFEYGDHYDLWGPEGRLTVPKMTIKDMTKLMNQEFLNA